MEKFKKLLQSKKAKPVSETEKSAKMDVLQDLKKHAMDMMGEKLHGLKKVTVASDSKEGIKKGLDKAKQILGKSSDEEEICPECEGEGCPACEIEESPEHEASESSEEETSEHELGEEPSDENMSEEELDAKIKELMKKKEALTVKK
jgi:hypothetical protein